MFKELGAASFNLNNDAFVTATVLKYSFELLLVNVLLIPPVLVLMLWLMYF